MKTVRWTGRAHDAKWNNAVNWFGGVPATGDNALFSEGGTWTLVFPPGDPSLGNLTILKDALTLDNVRIDLNAAPPKQGVTTDLVVAQNGSVALVDNALIGAENTIQIGGFDKAGTLSAGTLTVTNYAGGWSSGITVYDGLFAISGAGSGWEAAGQNSQFAMQVGGPGNTEITVSNGAGLGTIDATIGTLDIGYGGTGNGRVVVTGQYSNLTIGRITLGNEAFGTLLVDSRATVDTQILLIGESFGDGAATVTNDAVLSASKDINVGSDVLPVIASLTVTNHGSVYAGTSGLLLQQGSLVLDPTAVLFGSITSLGGHVQAIAAPDVTGGTVTLGQDIGLGDQASDLQFGFINTVGAAAGLTLSLAGQVTTADQDTVLMVTGGHVELSERSNHIRQIALAAGKLTIAATGADGGGTLSFLSPYSQATGLALLEVAAGAHLTDALTGLGHGDRIDLRGFAFGAGVTDSYANGTLTLANASTTTSLTLLGQYSAAEFTFGKDTTGGTLIEFHIVHQQHGGHPGAADRPVGDPQRWH